MDSAGNRCQEQNLVFLQLVFHKTEQHEPTPAREQRSSRDVADGYPYPTTDAARHATQLGTAHLITAVPTRTRQPSR